MLKVFAIAATVVLALILGALVLVQLEIIPGDSSGLLGAAIGAVVGSSITVVVRQRAAAARAHKMRSSSDAQGEKL